MIERSAVGSHCRPYFGMVRRCFGGDQNADDGFLLLLRGLLDLEQLRTLVAP